jgi:hypothetical protein
MSSYIPKNFVHVDGDVTIRLSQHAFNPNEFRVILNQLGEGDIRREVFPYFKDAMQCYLGMIADECDQYLPDEISPMVNR